MFGGASCAVPHEGGGTRIATLHATHSWQGSGEWNKEKFPNQPVQQSRRMCASGAHALPAVASETPPARMSALQTCAAPTVSVRCQSNTPSINQSMRVPNIAQEGTP